MSIYEKSTLHRCKVLFGAENGARTRDLNLGKVALYQLSYFRNKTPYLAVGITKVRSFFLICKLFLNFFVRVCSRVAEYGFAVFAVYLNLAVLAYFTFKDFLCKLVDQLSLNQSFDRTGTVFRVVAVLYHVVFKRFRE